MNLHTMYLQDVLDPKSLKQVIKKGVEHLKPIKKEFDTIVFRGMSGAMVAPAIAVKLNKNILMIRKAGEKCHSKYTTEGYSDAERCLFIDDFMESGDTVKEVTEAMRNSLNLKNPRIVGMYAYRARILKYNYDKLTNVLGNKNVFFMNEEGEIYK